MHDIFEQICVRTLTSNSNTHLTLHTRPILLGPNAENLACFMTDRCICSLAAIKLQFKLFARFVEADARQLITQIIIDLKILRYDVCDGRPMNTQVTILANLSSR